MADPPQQPDGPGGGTRQQRAAELRAQMERDAQRQGEQGGQGDETQETPIDLEEARDRSQESPEEEDQGDEMAETGPVGQGDYVVKLGDCVSSIAMESGHLPETIWNDPGNTELKGIRQNPNILLPGDRLTVAPITRKDEPGETEMRHRFRHLGLPEMLRLRLLDEFDKPRAEIPYILIIDGDQRQGTTNAEGDLEEPILPNAKKGKLFLNNDEEEIPLNLGHLQPITEISGIQDRLSNLGFECAAEDGEIGPRTRDALTEFQTAHDLPPTGRVNEDMPEELKERHGC